MMTEDKPVETREFNTGVLVGKDGRVIVNAAQQDLTLIRRKYDDKTIDLLVRNNEGGPERVVIARHPAEQEIRCPHCGEEL